MEAFLIRNACEADEPAIRRVHIESTVNIVCRSYPPEVGKPWAASVKAGAVNWFSLMDSKK